MTAHLFFEGLHTPHDKGRGALIAKVLQAQPVAQRWAGPCSRSVLFPKAISACVASVGTCIPKDISWPCLQPYFIDTIKPWHIQECNREKSKECSEERDNFSLA